MDTKGPQIVPPTPSFWRRASSLPVLPLALLAIAILGVYFANIIMANGVPLLKSFLSPYTLVSPIFAGLVLTTFFILYIYKAIRGRVPIYPQIVAWLFILLAILIPLYIYLGGSNDSTCAGFFSTYTSCQASRELLVFGLIFFNFIGITLLEGLALSGIVTLLLRQKRQ